MEDNNKGGSSKQAGADNKQAPPPQVDKPAAKPSLNAAIDLSSFNYKGEFIGKNFASYRELIAGKWGLDDLDRPVLEKQGLPQDKPYEFEGYKVVALRRKQNPNDKGSTATILAGFRFEKETPVRATVNTIARIEVLNSQIDNNNGKEPMIYYLLKKD